MDAIVYTSNTGFTEQYARMLGERTGLTVCSLKDARAALKPGAEVIYMGWLLGGGVMGYRKAAKRYHVRALCGVGMGATGSQLNEVRKANALAQDMPVFTLQGGMDLQKLRGPYKLMMSMATKAKAKEAGAVVTPEEADMLELVRHGGSRVSEQNLSVVLEWYRTI